MSNSTIKSFGYKKAKNYKGDIMNVPDIDCQVCVHIKHRRIKQKHKKISHHVNTKARDHPEMRAIEKIVLIL
jgi:hypothetical protein